MTTIELPILFLMGAAILGTVVAVLEGSD